MYILEFCSRNIQSINSGIYIRKFSSNPPFFLLMHLDLPSRRAAALVWCASPLRAPVYCPTTPL